MDGLAQEASGKSLLDLDASDYKERNLYIQTGQEALGRLGTEGRRKNIVSEHLPTVICTTHCLEVC